MAFVVVTTTGDSLEWPHYGVLGGWHRMSRFRPDCVRVSDSVLISIRECSFRSIQTDSSRQCHEKCSIQRCRSHRSCSHDLGVMLRLSPAVMYILRRPRLAHKHDLYGP